MSLPPKYIDLPFAAAAMESDSAGYPERQFSDPDNPKIRPEDPHQERAAISQLRNVNLNLLPVLQSLLRTRSVSKTAVGLELTTPAVSQGLRQLRATLDDEILVRVGRAVHLTERAEQLIGPLSRLMVELGGLLQPPKPFDPSREKAQFKIITVDFICQLLAPSLVRICSELAPGVGVHFDQAEIHGAEDLAHIDFLIAPRESWITIGKQAASMELWKDDIVCIVGQKGPKLGQEITPDEYRGHRHVSFELPWTSAQERRQLQPTYPLESASVCTSSSFLVLGSIVEQTDSLSLVPRKLATVLATRHNIRLVEFDHPETGMIIDAYWNRAIGDKRGHRWFRELLKSAVEQLALGSEMPPTA
ncbi:LysR family transcriptional regulator [Caballeronia novacaledonica]|uniref:LysR family transcriptional regulator n=1 Tax=Caballeronia novacaledonica TaxID=1544861 RepID=A0ACB5R652_9BURK|nr:LysR family transcriptional regulator [Caballeronia sp. LZ029]MDR5748869.1 LysR family transcriptional regulator [Caballeronia sp. LZ029]GJH22555.1 LysR family transcriptional regulator [Caballeronia novacaledonica]